MKTPHALVERLRAEAEAFLKEALASENGFDAEMNDATSELLTKAADRIEALEAALAPFADVGELFSLETEGFAETDELPLMTSGEEFRLHNLKFGWFVAARTALSEPNHE